MKTTRRKASAKQKKATSPRKSRSVRVSSLNRTTADGDGQVPPVDSVFDMKIEEIERRLANPEPDAELEAYFGPQFKELRQLAKAAESTPRAVRGPRPKALILPGIMGSTLGTRRLGIFHDTIWLDPLDTAFGRLSLLAMPSNKKILALDPFPLIYTGLKLALKAAGYDADYFPFDWRVSLLELGASLKAKLDSMGPAKVHLAAHSMGGLVARAALKQGAKNIGTVVMMGTPNRGSYSPVLALRGVHDLASMIGKIDLAHSGVALTEKVFSTFPGLTQMLPLDPIASGIDWHKPDIWPASPMPRPDVLLAGDNVDALLASPAKDWHLIAGMDQETIVSAERNPSGTGLRYRRSYAGDGTVPLESARIAEVKDRTFYVKHGHGTLPMNAQVRRALIELFNGQTVTALPREVPEVRPAPTDWVTDEQMSSRSASVLALGTSVRGGPPTMAEASQRLRATLESPLGAVAPMPVAPDFDASVRATASSAEPLLLEVPLDGYVVSHESQFYLEVELVHGDIAEVESQAIVLSKFQNMDLGRAAQAVDEYMDHVLADLMQRRMFSANIGEVFVLPTGRHPLRSDVVAITGLGPMDGFLQRPEGLAWETLELVAESTLRTLLGAGISEFATILFGNLAEAGQDFMRRGLAHLMKGFLRAIMDVKESDKRRFRRVTLCESDDQRFTSLKSALLSLLDTPLFASVRVRLDERRLPPPAHFRHSSLAAAAAGARGRDPAYLFVRATRDGSQFLFESTFSAPQGHAATFRETQPVDASELQKALDLVKPSSWTDEVSSVEVIKAGETLPVLLLHPTIREALAANAEHPIMLVHDEEASRIPWETLRLGPDNSIVPACSPGITRQYATGNLSVAKWMEERRRDDKLRVLLVVNPTSDLPGAKAEGERIQKILERCPQALLTTVQEAHATRDKLLSLFGSGEFDVVHYAGHAFFDPLSPERSGILCAPKDPNNASVLSGADLAGLGQLPLLVFFNACESARVRGVSPSISRGAQGRKKADHPGRIRAAVGFAEAFMRGGTANFVGTYWPVGDTPAKVFATSFYEDILKGLPLGEVVSQARKKLQALKPAVGDWADYIHFGSPNFVLKTMA
jgi:CHAT domain-containing protein/pimeloyl-ACP methyl ester carboxylesterase